MPSKATQALIFQLPICSVLSQLEAFALWGYGHHHFFGPKVPVSGHVECHVGKHHQVLTESKKGVDARLTVLVMAPEEVASTETEEDVEEEDAVFVSKGLPLLSDTK